MTAEKKPTSSKEKKPLEKDIEAEDKKLDAEIDKAEEEFFEKEKEAKAKTEGTKSESKKPEAKPKETPKFEVTDFNPWNVLKYPHLTEKSMNMVEFENKLVFIADRRAKKEEIKEAIERGFNVKVDAVNLEITRKGLKKVYAKLNSQNDAVDIASKLGML